MGLFGNLIKELRKKSRLTLSEVSEHLGLSPSFISDVEHGRRLPFENEKIISLAILLGGDANQLLDAASKEKRSIDLPIRGGNQVYTNLAYSLMRADSNSLGSKDTKDLMEKLIEALEKDKKNGQ